MPDEQPAVRSDALVKTYGRKGRIALDGLTLDIAEGETFGLLGPNGAGKTTFVKCVLGLLTPTSGSVTTMGQPAGNPAARRGVGFAPEVPNFPPFLSAREVMQLHARLAGASDDDAQISALLEDAGLADAPSRIKAFSKGMVRRLALAQAQLADPKLLILDEPTADLDPIGRRDVRVRLEEMKSKGTTIILNSHLLSEVERVCDRVAIIHKGKLLAIGQVDELVPPGEDLETVFVRLVEGSSR